MATYQSKVGPLCYAPPSVKSTLGGVTLLSLGVLCTSACIAYDGFTSVPLSLIYSGLSLLGELLIGGGVAAICAGCILHVARPDAARITAVVRRRLCDPRFGNPLHLREGEALPRVKCKDLGMKRYALTISCASSTVEDIAAVSPAISSALNRRYSRYAVTRTDTDIAFNHVTFIIENVTVDRSVTTDDIEVLRPGSSTKLTVDKVNFIDLTSSGHILAVGKTRSGKTTGVISLLLQALLTGPDAYGSQVVVIDPKRAELSMCPHTVTLDNDGEASAILAAMESYVHTVVERQSILNGRSIEKGDALHWWEAGFHPSFLFIDEFVALRSMLPKKAEKGNEGYCLATFESLLKRIVTTGASAGCYVIISIAEASVEEGGLPSMLRSAMSTRILFRPTLEEARLLWPPEKLENMNTGRIYGPGDAWFSSTDGEHDNPGYVHFPRMNFPVYRELGRLLQAYYGDTPE